MDCPDGRSMRARWRLRALSDEEPSPRSERRSLTTVSLLGFVQLGIYFNPVGHRCFQTMTLKPSPRRLAWSSSNCRESQKEHAAIADFIVGRDDRFVIVEQAIDVSGKTGQSQAKSYLAPSVAFLERAVEVGFPRVALRRLVERLVGDGKSKISGLEWDVVPKTTLERRKNKLSTEESERTERIARLFVHSQRSRQRGRAVRKRNRQPALQRLSGSATARAMGQIADRQVQDPRPTPNGGDDDGRAVEAAARTGGDRGRPHGRREPNPNPGTQLCP